MTPVFPPRPAVSQPGGIRGPATRPPAKDRRRSQSSEGVSRVSATEAAQSRLEGRRFELAAWIRTRRNLVVTRLIAVEETIVQAGGPGCLSPHWIKEELQFVLRTLEDTEKCEMEVWKLVARLDGPDSRHVRAQEWGNWFQQVMAKVGTIRGSMAEACRSRCCCRCQRSKPLPATGRVSRAGEAAPVLGVC